jgi:hypothetical protein
MPNLGSTISSWSHRIRSVKKRGDTLPELSEFRSEGEESDNLSPALLSIECALAISSCALPVAESWMRSSTRPVLGPVDSEASESRCAVDSERGRRRPEEPRPHPGRVHAATAQHPGSDNRVETTRGTLQPVLPPTTLRFVLPQPQNFCETQKLELERSISEPWPDAKVCRARAGGGAPEVVALLAAHARAGAGRIPRVPSALPRRNRPPSARRTVRHHRGRLHPRRDRQHRRRRRRAAGGRSADAAAEVGIEPGVSVTVKSVD